MIAQLALFAQTTVSAAPGENLEFEFGRIVSFGALNWIFMVLAVIIIAALVIYIYIRDCVELGFFTAMLLITLRLGAFAGLLWIFLQPQYRTTHKVVENSRVVCLIDTSLSMGLTDDGSSTNRLEEVVGGLRDAGLVEKLRQVHDVTIIKFDADKTLVGTISKVGTETEKPAAEKPAADDADKKMDDKKSDDSKSADDEKDAKKDAGEAAQRIEDIAWEAITPQGNETRLGYALRQVVNDERNRAIAGIVVFTDGGHNAGIAPGAAIAVAKDAGIPVFTVGLGSDKEKVNVRIARILAPARTHPGDDFSVSGLIQGYGLENQPVMVDLLSREAGQDAETAEVSETAEVVLGPDGEVVRVDFEMTPEDIGRRTLTLRVRPPQGDLNAKDNEKEADIEIVDRKTKVMLLAGGPTREYRFCRSMLYRDKQIELDILLQTAGPGVSQEAETILTEFPSSKDELYEYDCIIAFDPDWEQLTAGQMDLLEEWVAKQAGGLVVIAGPIYTDSWSQSKSAGKIRDLYPVIFHQRFALLDDDSFESDNPWPIEFTQEGLDAEFLWLEDSAGASKRIWSEFDGVYGYYSVKGPKLGATVYATFGDPRANQSGPAVYIAGQFVGSGRVLYLGSGEMWRLRSMDDGEGYFERFYTKVVRHVSQGRLLRGSSRGVLLVERDTYMLGNTVAVRAQLEDEQHDPLQAEQVMLEVIRPDNILQTVEMRALEGTPGTFSGQFAVYQEGFFRLQLRLDEEALEGDDVLSRRIEVRVPDLELEYSQRNNALLSEIATTTGGQYYVGMGEALSSVDPLAAKLPDRSITDMVSGMPVSLWDNQWVLFGVCGLLCLEWLVRRLAKLA